MKTPDSTMEILARLQHLAVEVSNTTKHDVTFGYAGHVNTVTVDYYEGGWGIQHKEGGWTRTAPCFSLIQNVAIDRDDFEEIAMEAIEMLCALLDQTT